MVELRPRDQSSSKWPEEDPTIGVARATGGDLAGRTQRELSETVGEHPAEAPPRKPVTLLQRFSQLPLRQFPLNPHRNGSTRKKRTYPRDNVQDCEEEKRKVG